MSEKLPSGRTGTSRTKTQKMFSRSMPVYRKIGPGFKRLAKGAEAKRLKKGG